MCFFRFAVHEKNGRLRGVFSSPGNRESLPAFFMSDSKKILTEERPWNDQ